MTAGWERARAIADAVLYEGYLLYPYRASSSKNQSRWQFGVLGPPGAAAAGLGEEPALTTQFVTDGPGSVTLLVRFLQLQHRQAARSTPSGGYEATDQVGSWLTWDEAAEQELAFGPIPLSENTATFPITVARGHDIETVSGGRLVRTREALHGELRVTVEQIQDSALRRVTVDLRNTAAPAETKDAAIAVSMIGTHVIAIAHDTQFVSLLEPPDAAAPLVAKCSSQRCFPVLAGPPGDHSLLLVSPIILYDHPEVAEQSEGALFDSTEIDEILTLRVMTMTDDEKAQARATDPKAAAIIDRCDAMSPESMQRLHGVLRDPHLASPDLIPEVPDGIDWWDPLADNAVRPDIDAVLVGGTRVTRGTRVRLRPSRRSDAQDMFIAGKTARVTSVHEDVDGQQHVAVVIEDDPAADLHDWYGRYLYFAPDEIEPLDPRDGGDIAATERTGRWNQ